MTTNTVSGSPQEAAAIPVSDTSPEPHPLAEAGRQASDTASHLAERATDVGLQQANRGRQLAAQGISQLAESIRRLSVDLESEQPALAGAASTAADQGERAARFLEESDVRQIIAKVEDAARRQPVVFLGGALLLGAIAARFLKAAGNGDSATSTELAGGRNAYASTLANSDGYTEGL